MKRIPSLLLCILLSALCFKASAGLSAADREKSIEILRTKLQSAKTPKDSVRILYDIFDLSGTTASLRMFDEFYATAGRAGDVSAQLDMLRQMTAYYREEKDFDALEKMARKLPASREQKETILFLQMKKLSYSSKFLPEAERQKAIARIITDNEAKKTADPRQRLLDLYTVVEYLRNEANGELLEKYLDRLVDLVNTDQFELYALRNIVFSEAANIYSDAGDDERAVEADRTLLKIIEGLEKKYAAQGREYRNYDRNKYICYRRMLRNSKGLAPGEADKLFAACTALAESDPDVGMDYKHFPRIHAYYHYAKGDYAKALPELKGLLDSGKPGTAERRILLSYIVTAAEKTGDDKTRMNALAEYNAMLREYEDLKAVESYKELQIKYDIMDLRERNAALELEASESELKSVKRTMTLELTAFGLVVVVLVAFLFYWSKYQRNTYNMGKVVDRLASERDKIRRSLYYDYADDPLEETSDAPSDHWRDRLKKKNKKGFEMSTFMTESIVNDLLYIAAVSHADSRKYINDISADRLMREAIREAKDRTGRHIFDGSWPEEDFRIDTDPDCLRALIAHILEVAANYSGEDGHVSLECTGHNKGYTSFAFVTPEQVFGNPDDPRLFDLFINTEEIIANRGTGLFICRMISLLIKCDFKSDRTWEGPGSRFILIVPDEKPLAK